MKYFLSKIGSYIIALLRFMLININFFFSGIMLILFSDREITNVELQGAPLRCNVDKDKKTMAFLDKLCLENPDLLDYPMDNNLDDFGDSMDFLDNPDQGDSEDR